MNKTQLSQKIGMQNKKIRQLNGKLCQKNILPKKSKYLYISIFYTTIISSFLILNWLMDLSNSVYIIKIIQSYTNDKIIIIGVENGFFTINNMKLMYHTTWYLSILTFIILFIKSLNMELKNARN